MNMGRGLVQAKGDSHLVGEAQSRGLKGHFPVEMAPPDLPMAFRIGTAQLRQLSEELDFLTILARNHRTCEASRPGFRKYQDVPLLVPWSRPLFVRALFDRLRSSRPL